MPTRPACLCWAAGGAACAAGHCCYCPDQGQRVGGCQLLPLLPQPPPLKSASLHTPETVLHWQPVPCPALLPTAARHMPPSCCLLYCLPARLPALPACLQDATIFLRAHDKTDNQVEPLSPSSLGHQVSQPAGAFSNTCSGSQAGSRRAPPVMNLPALLCLPPLCIPACLQSMTNMFLNHPLAEELKPFARRIAGVPNGGWGGLGCLGLAAPVALLLRAWPQAGRQRQLLSARRVSTCLAACHMPGCPRAPPPPPSSRPAVHPGMAHALATRYGSLGGLMDVLLDSSR